MNERWCCCCCCIFVSTGAADADGDQVRRRVERGSAAGSVSAVDASTVRRVRQAVRPRARVQRQTDAIHERQRRQQTVRTDRIHQVT